MATTGPLFPVFLAAVLAAAPVVAQTPSSLSDLVGARAGQSEAELQRRGYSVPIEARSSATAA